MAAPLRPGQRLESYHRGNKSPASYLRTEVISHCMKIFAAVAIILAGSLLPLAAHAQRPATTPGQAGPGTSQPLNPSSSNMPIFNVMRGGEIQIDVNLWGFVNAPGHYRVPGSTSLVELLSFAGGP